MRILIVEDDPSIRPFLDAYLTGRGFNTLVAESAAHADALLLDFPAPPDIAVLDLLLPGVQGLAYAQMLRHRYPAIGVVFMTGWLEGPMAESAEMHGQVLRKPFYPTDLLNAIAASEPRPAHALAR
jgi:DNA-binding response OmpR family regulator